MSREIKAEVLVVGAGPVGMTTALLLAEQGLQPAVIDAKGGPAARSYACALHPHTLERLERLGLNEELLKSGRRLDTVAFYEGSARRAEVKFSDLDTKYPFLTVLSQSALEGLLERTLNHRAGIRVHWHHRLSHLRSDTDGVVAAVDKLGGTSLGYIVPHWEVIVEKTTEVKVPFLAGADGHNSLVRRCLGIDYEPVGEPEIFMVFEFETDTELANEVCVVLDESTTNVLWPLPGGRCRWSFQVKRKEPREVFPEKDRRAVWIEDPEVDRRIRQRLQQLIQERAPWFTANVKEFDWVSQVQFEHRLAKRYGDGRSWLVGDAAHQTGPVGVHSVNVGMSEADELASTLKNLLHGGATANVFETCDRRWRAEWQQLFGLKGPLKAAGRVDEWVQRRAARILPCLPASGNDLARLLKQLHLELP